MTRLKYFDAHSHLRNQSGPARSDLTLCNGTSPHDWPTVFDMARGDTATLPCFGLHPWFINSAGPDWLDNLTDFLKREPRAGVGEIGLDAVKNRNRPKQEAVFTAQLKLAKKLNRPACLHCVRSYGRMLEIIKAVRPQAFMLHAYGGPKQMTAQFAALGAYFSFGAGLAGPAGENMRRALLDVPPGRLLFETESCAQHDLSAVIRTAAKCAGTSEAELTELSWANGNRFLRESAYGGNRQTAPFVDRPVL